MNAPRSAVLLLSGGLDSTTMLAMVARDQYHLHTITFHYGQRHATEVERARQMAERYGVARHIEIEIDLRTVGGSALTDDIAVPKDRDPSRRTDIPVTYVPARNTIFLAYALAWAEVLNAGEIFI